MSINIYRDRNIIPITETKGHQILDEDGDQFTHRKRLQFLNSTIIDDPQNDRLLIYFRGVTDTPVAIPIKSSTILTYNELEQSIPWEDPIDIGRIELTGDKGTNAGNYVCTASLKEDNYIWTDETNEPKVYNWSIEKAEGSITAESTDITVSLNNPVIVPLTILGDGQVTILNNDPTNFEAIYNTQSNILTITTSSATETSSTIEITLGEGQNYLGDSVIFNVSSEGGKPELVSWSTGTDEEISNMLNGYYNDLLTLEEIQTVWHEGDIRPVTISAMPATGVNESHREQTIQMKIIDFLHDDLTTPINGHNKALISLHPENCLMAEGIDDTNGQYNTEHGYLHETADNSVSWQNCDRRIWCNSICYNAFPVGFKNMIKQVNKYTSAGNQSENIITTADYIWLVSDIEVCGNATYSQPGEGFQYSHYVTVSNRYKSPHWNASSNSDSWLSRSPYKGNATYYCYINTNGGTGTGKANVSRGLAIGCCM